MTPARHRRSRRYPRLLILALAAVLVAGGAALTVRAVNQASAAPRAAAVHPFQVPTAQIPDLTARAASSTAPTASPTATLASHIYVPTLHIAAPWVSVGFSFTTGLAVPTDVHTVGLSAQGGQLDKATGTVLMAGHVNYVGQGAGTFQPLTRIQPGAAVITTDSAGHRSVWVVVSLRAVRKQDLPHSLFTDTGPRRLVMVTCGGQLHHGNYDDNIVVTAVPAGTTGGRRAGTR